VFLLVIILFRYFNFGKLYILIGLLHNFESDHNSYKNLLHPFNLKISPESLSLSLFLVAPTLEHSASVKRFVSLQFLNPKTVGRTPWTGDQPVARPLPTETQNKRKQTSTPSLGFEPTIPEFMRGKAIHTLNRAATVIGYFTGMPDKIS
jgi:hypothetical protein